MISSYNQKMPIFYKWRRVGYSIESIELFLPFHSIRVFIQICIKALFIDERLITSDSKGLFCSDYSKTTSLIEIQNSEIHRMDCQDLTGCEFSRKIIIFLFINNNLSMLSQIMFKVPPSIHLIEGDEDIDGKIYYKHGSTIAISPQHMHERRKKRSVVNNCYSYWKGCDTGKWISLDTSDGTGDHENFP